MIARFLSTLRRTVGSRGAFTVEFGRERARIREIVQSLDSLSLAQPTLIARVRGLEDSSRNWSVLMTLEHLRIVHQEMRRVIYDLACGRTPSGTASTAAVKPASGVSISVLADYEASCDALLSAAAAPKNLRTAVRFAHPWFGPMDAHGWYALAASHLRIHRVQIERIVAALNAARDS